MKQSLEELRAVNAARMRRWKAEHRARLLEIQRQCDRRRAAAPARRASMRRATGAWAARHRPWLNLLAAVNQSNRRARLRSAGGAFSAEEWLALLEVFGHRCAYCLVGGVKLQAEHVIPIARGGRGDISNIVPSCGPCNFRKHARGPLAMVNRMHEVA